MKSSPLSVVLVYSTSHAIRLEKLLQAQKIPCRLIPVPRHLSSDCGISLRAPRSKREEIGEILGEAGVEITGIHDF